jgi:hypothetical protein
MSDFRRITEHEDRASLQRQADMHHALLSEALNIASHIAQTKSQLVAEIIATGTVEGIASSLDAKAAAVSFRAEKYKRTWHSLIPWRYLEGTTADEQAESLIQTIEDNIEMTETNFWPALPEGEEGDGGA